MAMDILVPALNELDLAVIGDNFEKNGVGTVSFTPTKHLGGTFLQDDLEKERHPFMTTSMQALFHWGPEWLDRFRESKEQRIKPSGYTVDDVRHMSFSGTGDDVQGIRGAARAIGQRRQVSNSLETFLNLKMQHDTDLAALKGILVSSAREINKADMYVALYELYDVVAEAQRKAQDFQ